MVSQEGNGTPLQDSALENPMDGGAWWATVHGVTDRATSLSLSMVSHATDCLKLWSEASFSGPWGCRWGQGGASVDLGFEAEVD